MDSIASGNVSASPGPDASADSTDAVAQRIIGAVTRARVRIFMNEPSGLAGQGCEIGTGGRLAAGRAARFALMRVGRVTAGQRRGCWNGRNQQLGMSSPAAVLAPGGRRGAGLHRTCCPRLRAMLTFSQRGRLIDIRRSVEAAAVKRPWGDGIVPWGKRVLDTVLVATTECRSTCLLLRSTARGRGGSDNNR
jgi:hypothetical protein